MSRRHAWAAGARGAGGQLRSPMSLLVVLRYASNPVVYFVDRTIAPNVPSKAGGAVSTWMVKPALPRGLVFNDTDAERLPRRPKCIDWDGTSRCIWHRRVCRCASTRRRIRIGALRGLPRRGRA